MNLRSLTFGPLAVLLMTSQAHAVTACESLKSLPLENTTITLAQSVVAGEFSLPAQGQVTAQQNAIFKQLPAFCRVAATLKPSSDSDIKIEVWMPLANWNGKFQAVGNGGWAGSITYSAGVGGIERGMAQALMRGYVTASKYPMIHQAVVAKCDALDGVKDGLIEDPTQCHFDPKILQCKGADGAACLTAAQVAAARVIMSPVKDRHTGAEIFPGFAAGNELGWGLMLGGPEPYYNALDDFKYVVFGK